MGAFVHYNGLPMLFVHSLVKSVKSGAMKSFVEHSSARINAARTENGKKFLESDCEYIFYVDTDMLWEPSELIKLHEYAKKSGVKAVSGWTLMPKNGLWPHAFRQDGTDFVPYGHIPPYSDPIKVDAVGGACFLVHRDVLEAVKANYEDKTEYVWQEEVFVPALLQNRGEDIEFSRRITEAGFDIHYHPDAIFTHVKPQPMGPTQYTRFYSALEAKLRSGEYEEHGSVEHE